MLPLLRRMLTLALPLLAIKSTAARPAKARLEGAWWRDRHVAKLAEIRARPPRLVFLGDSITQQWEMSGPPTWRDFTPVWEYYYGDRAALNLGFSGDDCSNLLWRIEHDEVEGMAPAVAVVLIGTNDLGRMGATATEIFSDIETILDALRQRLPTTRMLLLGLLPSARGRAVATMTQAVNRRLATIAGVRFLDVSDALRRDGVLDPNMFCDPLFDPPEDPLHPSAAGQARMAAAMEPVLAEMLGGILKRDFGIVPR